MKVRFLIDENLSPELRESLLRYTTLGKLAEELLMIWEASEAQEWIDIKSG